MIILNAANSHLYTVLCVLFIVLNCEEIGERRKHMYNGRVQTKNETA